MRIAIREQLAALVLLAVLVSLAILSIPTWVFVNRFVTNVETNALSLAASLKASSVAAELELLQTTTRTISTRILIQNAFRTFYLGNDTEDNWASASNDLQSALNAVSGGSTNLLQVKLYSRNTTGNVNGLFNLTGQDLGSILLPYGDPDGSPIYLGDTNYGYPTTLYPNITYYNTTTTDPLDSSTTLQIARPWPDIRIDNPSNGLILGPLVINTSYALVSLTVPIKDNLNSNANLGYMTMIAEATALLGIVDSREGLGSSGALLVVGPDTGWNRFSKYNLPANSTNDAASNISDATVRFVLPPTIISGYSDRHSDRNFEQHTWAENFQLKDYPAVLAAFKDRNTATNNASSYMSTTNEQGIKVAVGFARPQTSLVNWTLVVEQEKSEAYAPISTLRKIILGCVFGTLGLVIILIFPCAHFSVQPIRQLKSATEKSVAPPGYDYRDELDFDTDEVDPEHPASTGISTLSEKGWLLALRRKIRGRRRPAPSEHDSDPRRRVFKIPGRVKDRKHYITDELTELTEVFNEMGEELLKQYGSLEQKVAERTSELEVSKKAAEAANESKTLFIANISHELKTPLNGILGMCAVCMEEDDVVRIKQSLKTLYKSGDLLLHLLEDLLSFSKNQIGQQLRLEEKEFRLGDIRSQVLTIFDKQVREGKIDFSVTFLSTDMDPGKSPERESMEIQDPKLPAMGPQGVGRLKDMCLWGDQHRILQVVINLVSNSLKFTPSGGRVSVRIRCVGEVEQQFDESRTSSFSRNSGRAGRTRHRMGSGSNRSNHSGSSKGATTPQPYKGGTALSINPMDPKATPHIHIRERSPTPPPPGARSYLFEIEVEDTGPGIPEHMQQRVFEPFVQGDLGLSKKFGGTGLGLSICHQLAGLMGGSIGIKSTVGVGTTFTVRIPLKYTRERASSTASSSVKSRPPSVVSAPPEADTHRNSVGSSTTTEAKVTVLENQPRLIGLSAPFFATSPGPSPTPSKKRQLEAIDRARAAKAGGKLRVLVADDNSVNVEVVSKLLRLEDIYDVTIAKDGQEAYDIVKASMDNNIRFDVIFMDIQMPNLDGLQSTRLIRKMGYEAPIVALTAFSEESNVKECMESGMDEFLAKPIRRPALKQVLKRFATIPEEPEVASLHSTKMTPDKTTPDKTTPTAETPATSEQKVTPGGPEVSYREVRTTNGTT
ncbi:Histidine kinase [Neopestalotiopsis sp. 37M]|nr:Histidine kinase [Neopestalotiopsis sp. 37M]